MILSLICSAEAGGSHCFAGAIHQFAISVFQRLYHWAAACLMYLFSVVHSVSYWFTPLLGTLPHHCGTHWQGHLHALQLSHLPLDSVGSNFVPFLVPHAERCPQQFGTLEGSGIVQMHFGQYCQL